ncbi:hypothetical protein Pint_32476 [Pistacia integerrima]|uniref:Uncharacterized protein n=1 Tax=Pistacia integerrima TaxID=434235 RepID=A0ACC0XR00_9ROSI|nr:hypothetical protein Pint_32476 [Pistacia integerrima]
MYKATIIAYFIYNLDDHLRILHSNQTLMNSNKFLSLLLHLFLIISSLSPANSRVVLSNPQNGKVSLELYYETLCPYCSNFTVNYLNKLFQSGLISVTDLKLIPYGNAKIGPNNTISCQVFEDDDLLSVVDLHLYPWGNAKIRNGTNTTFDCQHGPSECLLNTVEACAIAIWPDVNEHFQFIYCVETLVYEHKYPEWETCFEKLGLDPKAISDCYTSGNGTELELKYAAETNSLEPPHQYVPWVVVDGQPLYEDYENFISYICKAYNGTALPKACSNITLNAVYKEKAEPTGPVCNKETTTWST